MAKTYKCQYCEKRFIRKDLINHIENKHEEMIPEGFSASRLVYNQINKVSYGKCRVCGKETTWNEKAGRYNVLCSNPKCKEHMREEYKKNMLRVKGTYNILNDPEQQKKMLANRSISGKYKFTTDGGELTYTGSYEKKCLEFMDVVMQIPSTDILSPGPTLEYEYNGEKHFYITDFYYIPYNLIIEVKDGGDNPNNKKSVGMISSREKTIEKEHLITDKGEYNYIRLTNNNFAQLIEIFMVIKEKLLEGDVSKTYKINESVFLETSDRSTLSKNFKSKTPDFTYQSMNIKDKRAFKYLKDGKVFDDYYSNDNILNISNEDEYFRYFINGEGKKNDGTNNVAREGELLIDTTHDKLIGYFTVEKESKFLSLMIPNKKYRGYGFGKMMAKDSIQKYGCKELWVAKDNQIAIKLYKDIGFEIIDDNRYKDWYHMKINNTIKESVILESSNNKRRILLTSTGFTNKNIEKVFKDNINKPMSKVKVIFVPTAANDAESRSIIPECYKDLTDAGVLDKNIIIYNLDRKMFLNEIMNYDAIYFCGGSEQYLIDAINKINFSSTLINAINNGLFFIGVSAGSMILTSSVKNGLGIIPNKLEPHCEKNITSNGNIILDDSSEIRLSDNQALWINGNISTILESNNEFKNETELLNWMKNNIRYEHNDSSWKLKSYEEILQTKSGDCHDQSLFEYTVFNQQNIKCGRLFIIEYYGDKIHNAGATHTICYFIKNNKYYWFENAWDNKRGIHGPYSNLNELKEDIYINWEFSGKNDKLYICNLSGVKPGMDLEEYVTTALDTFSPKKYYSKNIQESVINENDIEQIILGKKQPLQKQITLYHGTDKSDLNIITPNSYNAGQKNDIPKMSSFWFNQKEYAESFAALTLIENYNYNIYVTLDNDMKVILDREYKNDILKYLKTVKGYVYEKTVDMSIVGYGHEGVFPEYTLDVPVKPDKRHIIMPNNLINRVKFVSKEYLLDIKTKYKNGKMNYGHNFIQMILDKDILYYSSCNERNNKIKQIAQLADMTNNVYFRITYNNIGIYEAFKQNIPWDVWINFKKSKECNWLPLPPKYEDGYYSYFTYEGYKKFMKLTYPEMIKYLDEYKIKVEKLNIDKNAIIYSDKYQVVVNSKLIEESAINEANIFINQDNFEYNTDTLKPNSDNNILFITGYSGSGKSTTMARIYEKYGDNVYTVAGDSFFMTCRYKYRIDNGDKKAMEHPKFSFMSKESRNYLGPVLCRYFDTYYNNINVSIDKFNNPELFEYWEHFIRWLIKDTKENKVFYRNKIVVVEGIQISNTNPELYKNHALIITGTSAFTSWARKANRDIFEPKKYDWKHLKMLFTMIPVYANDYKKLNNLSKSMQESSINESTGYDKYSKDIHKIIDSLSEEESNHIGNGYWVDSNHVIYRKVEYIDNEPVGFIDIYRLPKFDKRTGLVVIAVSEKARGKGIGRKLVNEAIFTCKENKDVYKLRWKADSDNTASINMAKSLGFKLIDENKNEKIFMYDLKESSINETYINTHNTGTVSFMTEAYIDYISRKYKSDVTTINLRFVHSTNAIQAIKSKCKYRIYNNDYIVIDIGYNVYVVDDVVYNRVPQDVTYNSFLKFHLTKVILSRYMKDENERLINAIATYESGVYAESYKIFKSSQIKDAEIYAKYLNKYGSNAVVDNLYRGGHTQYPIFEACKDVNEARKFLQDVDKISQKYNANFFIVTDGASMTRNGRGESNPAVKNARDSQVDWENKNGGDPDEDWLKDKVKESTNIFNFIEE